MLSKTIFYQIISQRSALLSNYEVLTLLRELESDHLAKARTALKIKKEEEAAGSSSGVRSNVASLEGMENLRTIEVEVCIATSNLLIARSRAHLTEQAIQYLSADYQPTCSQSEASVQQLTRDLAAYDLTKAEKLQIVNLAPVEAVELYVVSRSLYAAVLVRSI